MGIHANSLSSHDYNSMKSQMAFINLSMVDAEILIFNRLANVWSFNF